MRVAAVILLSASLAQAASYELVARARQSPLVAEWREAHTVRLLVELVAAADEVNLDAERVVARDVSLLFFPTRVVRRAEVLGFPTPPAGQPLDLFLGNTSQVLLHLETAPTSAGRFRLGELRVSHAPLGKDSVVETRRDVWLTMVIDPETRAYREAREAREIDEAESSDQATADTDEGDPADADEEPEPIEPELDPQVEERAAAIEAVHAHTRSRLGNPAAERTLAECLGRRDFNLVIDPGHDVDDPRGERAWEEFVEFELNDNFAERLAERVALPRLRVALSRERDEALPLPERVRAIAELEPDLVVSIHHDNVNRNRQTARRVHGNVVRTCDDHLGFSIYVGSSEARRAGRFVADGLLASGRVPGRFYAWGDFEHGVYWGTRLYLLRNLEPPTLLVEVGYMCNRGELKRVQSRRFIDQQAAVIADAIRRYVASRCAR